MRSERAENIRPGMAITAGPVWATARQGDRVTLVVPGGSRTFKVGQVVRLT